jgi:hypothetical protein
MFFLRLKKFEVFDQDGSIVDTISVGSVEEDHVMIKGSKYIGQIYPLIVKDQIIAIDQEKRLVSSPTSHTIKLKSLPLCYLIVSILNAILHQGVYPKKKCLTMRPIKLN